MIEDFRNYVENYYNDIDTKNIDKIMDICKNNNYLLKFIILTIKSNISIFTYNNESNIYIIKRKKKLIESIHQKRRNILKEYGKQICNEGLKKNYSEDTEELMDSVNTKYLSLVKDINIIDKILKYLNNSKYNIESSLKKLEKKSDNIFIEEYSN